MRMRVLVLLFTMLLSLLAGCVDNNQKTVDVEATATYDWMAGESPVSNRRIGVVRQGVNIVNHAVSPTGIYFIPSVIENCGSYSVVADGNYIWYVENGSDKIIKLCGRADCTHNSSDCNAYLYSGTDLTYYNGYLYAVSGEGAHRERCTLVKMNPDGSNHTAVFDILKFAKENGGDYAYCDMIINGYCLFSLYRWEVSGNSIVGTWMEQYRYKLDGSMKEPKKVEGLGGTMYQCGDVLLSCTNETKDGQQYKACWNLDIENETKTYLTEHPGIPGWFGEDAAYYFKDGAIVRLDYSTGEESVMVNTGLEGKYFASFFPDCMIVSSQEDGAGADHNLYFYNWDFQLVDTVELKFPYEGRTQFVVIAETAERVILSDKPFDGQPVYYINKSELGTGNAKVHKFVMPG